MDGGLSRIAMLSLHSSPIGALGTRDTGGMSVYVVELSRVLGERGLSVDMYTQGGHGQIVHLAHNVRLIHLSIGSRRPIPKHALHQHLTLFYRQLEAFRRSEKLRYDLIHSHYWLSGCLGERARRDWHAPHVVTFHTLGAVKNRVGAAPREPAERIAAEQRLARASSAVIVGAERERQHLTSCYHADPERVLVVPCGVNLERFQPLDRDAARRRLGIGAEEKVILYVGRLDPLKGVAQLIEAFASLREIPRRTLLIAGGGADDPAALRLRARAERLQVHDRVVFAGRVPHSILPLYYSAADVAAIPSRYESFGLVALEALACGTPLAATPVGAMERLIPDPRFGRVAPDGSPENLARALREVMTRRAHSGDVALRRALAMRYGWPRVATQILAAYRTIVKEYRSAAYRSQCARERAACRAQAFR